MSPDRRQFLRGIGTATVAAVVPVGSAIADDDEDDEQETAGLRVAHASPDAPAVDVYVDGSKAVGELAFRSVTEYLDVPTGEREVSVTVAGTDTTVFGPATLELDAEDYTAVARGEVTSDDTAFTVDTFEDTNGANLDDDEARVRAIHASPDAPGVDVTVDDDALTVFDGVEYGESSGYAVVTAGEYDIEIRPAGGGEPVFETTASLSAGSTYTVFAVGYLTTDDDPTDEAFGLVLSEDATVPPRGKGAGDDEQEDDDRGNGKRGSDDRGNGKRGKD
jgi:hypothetical protein